MPECPNAACSALTQPPPLPRPAAVRAGRTELTRRDIYAGVDRFTQVRAGLGKRGVLEPLPSAAPSSTL
jgi:hypothetical protein